MSKYDCWADDAAGSEGSSAPLGIGLIALSMKRECSECGKNAAIIRKDYDYSSVGLPVVLENIEIVQCKSCGYEEALIPKMSKIHRLIALAVIQKPYRLTGAEVRYLRKWLGLNAADTATVAWLVRNHLVMSDAAQKRDVSDPKTVQNFVQAVQTPERLRLLLILTVADIRAVGPGVWNGWKGQLLRELYYEAETLMSGGHSSPARGARIEEAKRALEARIKDFPELAKRHALSRHYDPYWLAFEAEELEFHARLMRAADEKNEKLAVGARTDASNSVTEIVIYTPDHAGLFSRLAGAISISGGPQNYPIADGFLFMRGATNGGSRGASWLNPRTAFRQTGIVTLRTHDILLQGFYLEPNYNPSTHTKLAGVNFQTPLGEYLSVGFTYCNLFRSDTAQEKGMNVFYGRADATPVPAFPDFHLIGAFVAESNGQRATGANGWYASPYYEFLQLPWTPTLYYRYASFTGGGTNGNHNFDPLFYGSSDWGSWYQGEILGNWLVTNSNLITHQVRAEFSPAESTTIDVLFYKFLLYSREQDISIPSVAPVTSKNLADEIDFAFQYAPTPWWLIAATISAAIPERAATQITGGTQTWVQSMLTTSFTF